MTGLILVGHGSPDPDWAAPVEAVATSIRRQQPQVAVATAYLSGGAESLDQALKTLSDGGVHKVSVFACLLSAGGKHVKRDLPELVAGAQKRWPSLEIKLVPGALGSAPNVLDALASAAVSQLGAT